jgi:hypothetical protein
MLVENDLRCDITLEGERERERERASFGMKATHSWYVNTSVNLYMNYSKFAYNLLPSSSSALKFSEHHFNTQSLRSEITNFIIDA